MSLAAGGLNKSERQRAILSPPASYNESLDASLRMAGGLNRVPTHPLSRRSVAAMPYHGPCWVTWSALARSGPDERRYSCRQPADPTPLRGNNLKAGVPPAGDSAHFRWNNPRELRSERCAARLIDGDRRQPRRGQYRGHVGLGSAGSFSREELRRDRQPGEPTGSSGINLKARCRQPTAPRML